MRLTPNKLSLACAMTLTMGFTSVAQAQLEEIIVTATKRSESLQDVGFSVQAFDKRLLEQGGVTDVSRLDLLVSGVNFAFTGNDAKFNVRGANSSNTFGDNASIVGAFVDNVFKPRASQQTRAFFDVERVEFLKGPQGTLYGRNTFAGALNLYTVAPSIEDGFTGNAQVSFESFDRTRVSGALNIPISDTFAARVAITSDQSDGYINNLAGDDIGAQDDQSFRISALWQPSENVNFLLRYQRSEEDGREAGLFGYTFICRNEQPNGLTDPFGPVENCSNSNLGSSGAPSANALGPYTISQDYVPEVDLVEDSITLEGNFQFSGFNVKSVTNYTDFENLIGFDFDFSPSPFQRGGFDDTIESFSQEIQISSDSDGPFQWTGGLYYSEDELFTSFSIFNQTVAINNRGTAIAPDGSELSILSGSPLASLETSLGGPFADANLVESDTFGAFAEIEYAVSDDLRLTAGIRFSDEEKSFRGGSNFTGDTNGDGNVDPVVTTLFNNGDAPVVIPEFSRNVFSTNPGSSDAILVDESYDNTTFRLGFEYGIGDGGIGILYGNYSTGFLSGSLSAGGATDEQESEVFEIGVKTQLFNNTLKLNAALHSTTYDNLLTQVQIPVGNIVVTESVNGGEINADGVEIEAVYQPNDALFLSANVSILDSEYGVFGVGNPFQLFNGQVVPFIDQEGQVTPWSPDLTATLAAGYSFDLGSKGTITPFVQFFYSDEYFTSNIIGADPTQLQDSFTKTDLRLTWEHVDAAYSVELFVENLEDEAVLARGNNNGSDIVQTSFLFPRNAGLRLRARF